MKRALIWCLAALMLVEISGSGIRHALLADDPAPTKNGAKKGDNGTAKPSPAPAKAPVPRTGDVEIEKALTESTQLEFEETPLKDVIDYIDDKHRLAIQFDRQALIGASIDPSTLASNLKIRDVSLESALALLLQDYGLTTIIENDVLMVTTKERADTQAMAKAYDVSDLVGTEVNQHPYAYSENGAYQPDFDSLIDLLTSVIAAPTWGEQGGPGSIQPASPGCIVVLQTRDVLSQIDHLFLALRQAKEQTKKGNFSGPIDIGNNRAAKSIEKALSEKIDLEFAETPLWEVLAAISKRAHIQILFDNEALKTANLYIVPPKLILSPRSPAIPPYDPSSGNILKTTVGLHNVPLASALNYILKENNLTWIIDHEVLLITTKEKADTHLETRVYPIGDLLEDEGSTNPPSAVVATPGTDDLVDVVTSAVLPPTWSEMGGPGTIQPYGEKKDRVLVVSQTQEAQAHIANLLSQLRELNRNHPKTESSAATKPAEEKVVLKIYNLAVPTSDAPAMTPQEVVDLVKEFVEPKSWTGSEVFIRGVTGKLIVRQVPSVQQKVEQLLYQLYRQDRPGALGHGMGGKSKSDKAAEKSGGSFCALDNNDLSK